MFYITPSNVNDNIIGNIYIGLESHKENSNVFSNIGVYLPTIPDDKFVPVVVNLYGDVDQYESYIPNYTTVAFRLNNNTNSINENGLGAILRLGISGMIYTGKSGSANDDIESMLSYAVQPTFHFNAVDVLIGFSGKMILTEDGDLDRRVLHQAGLSASYSLQFLRFTMFARIPVNEQLRNLIDNTYGGAVTIAF